MTGAALPQAALLPDGERLHLHHGPIDLILWAQEDVRIEAYARAIRCFGTVLQRLVEELLPLRSPAPVTVTGSVAQRMAKAVNPFATVFITPMAAVAGAVADEMLAAMVGDAGADPAVNRPRKAWVNNGGDIAVHLTPDETFAAVMMGGSLTIRDTDPSRGIATSGWRGRSQSFGIADAVTVLAATAAQADAAATLISNAVDLPGHPAITRRPATEVKADSDLGTRLVTVGVGPLTPVECARALDAGVAVADHFVTRGLIHAAHLTLGGLTRATAALTENIDA